MITLLSLGAGVQSSTMALMAARGEIKPMPTAAIFADVQAEPKSVYKWLDWLEKQLPFPVVRVTKGNLEEISCEVRTSRTGTHYVKASPPAFMMECGVNRGPLMRQCTVDFKIKPIQAMVRKMCRGEKCSMLIGISLDEIYRMKESRIKTIEHRWPLIELRMTRKDCLEWMIQNGYPKPPRSACVFCPYHGNLEWRKLKDDAPDEFNRAVLYEKKLQSAYKQVENFRGVPFLHRTAASLSEVDFSTEEERGQGSLFNNECEGICGV